MKFIGSFGEPERPTALAVRHLEVDDQGELAGLDCFHVHEPSSSSRSDGASVVRMAVITP